MNVNLNFPNRIICLTEESVETLALLDKLHLVVGASSYVKRPDEAKSLPKVSLFTSSNYKKILELAPDLVLGFSDIQKDIARDLIGMGLATYISNQRSIEEILNYISSLARLVDAKEEGEKLIKILLKKINEAQNFSKTMTKRPRVYFEEWDEPMISAISWVSELIEICGGIDINKEKSSGVLAKERFVESSEIITKNPDIIFACHCGKKVKLEKIYQRENFDKINAVKTKNIFELEPEIFLQPGPAPILDGIDILIEHFKRWACEEED